MISAVAVFPDRIVLKNSTDSDATIQTAIGTGGSDAIVQGEVVVGIDPADVALYTLDGSGNVVKITSSFAAGRAIVSDNAPTVGINGKPLADGDLWFESDTGDYYVYYSVNWVQISGGSG